MARSKAIMLCLVLAAAAFQVTAKRLPIQVYTIAQGLPRNLAACLVPDSNGLLWICTSEGLVRFDGSEFRTFGRENGLPSNAVADFLVSRRGGYWVSTDAGVCRLQPGSKVGDKCTPLAWNRYPGDSLLASLAETDAGRLVVITTLGLYRASDDGTRLDPQLSTSNGEEFRDVASGPNGTILIAGTKGVLVWDGHSSRRLPGLDPKKQCGFGQISARTATDVLVGDGNCGLFRVIGFDSAEGPRLEPVSLGRTMEIGIMTRGRNHSLWISALPGLVHFEELPDGRVVERERLGMAEGLPYWRETQLTEDSQGNIWGSAETGLFRIMTSGFQVYNREDGLGNSRIRAMIESRAGDLSVITSQMESSDLPALHVKQGDRFETFPFKGRPPITNWGWGWNQVGLQAHDGEWWIPGARGLFRYPALKHPRDLETASPIQVYGRQNGFTDDEVFRLFEDSHGDIWLSTLVSPKLMKWERSTGRFHVWTVSDGWPKDTLACAIRESKSGTIWLGSFRGEVFRFRHGRFEKMEVSPTPSTAIVRDLFIDSKGRVWIANSRYGVYRCDNPEDSTPVFRRYSRQDGLSSESTRSIIEDNAGMIYVGTVRGVDRLDPQSPPGVTDIRHFTVADGLPAGEQNVAHRDQHGHLWFGTLYGLAEFDPNEKVHRELPEVYVRAIRVRGEDIPLPWQGTRNESLQLQSDQNQVEIQYAGIDLSSVAWLRYQYRMEGVDADWSSPSTETTVKYANIPSGSRRFDVRAVNYDGTVGPSIASVVMNIKAPLWQRAWFLALAALTLGSLVYALYRYRVGHLLAVERIRTGIATDLHDDIGASLTQISLLSEVGRRDTTREVLGDIASISRELVQDMSDIVWAVSPRHDRFDAIVHRMRHFSEGAMPDGEVFFDTLQLPSSLPLPLEYRRPLYLIFKESVTNVVRHSGATRLTVRMSVKDGLLYLEIEDNGRGFDTDVFARGEGLGSIRRRILGLGGAVRWDSAPGNGTRLTVSLPIRSRTALPVLGGTGRWLRWLR